VTEAIAVIGLGCVYPEADGPRQLWENVLSQRRSFRRLPPERIRLADYLSADRRVPDSFYSRHAAVLDDYAFDRVRFRVSGPTFRATDLTHWLALDVAERALADAHFDELSRLDRARVGVVVGNTLTGEFTRAGTLRVRWPYVRRVVGGALAREGWSPERRAEFLAGLERDFKAPFPPVGEDSLAGGLSNTIAGRICNHFDLHGGGYTVDAACASSLLAVITAATSLAAGDLDLALAGGVDLSLDPFELVGFAKVGALAEHAMRVYDRRSAGFWPGEGCGFVALARHEDAVRWGARTYAVIRGWGISSDGSGGITRPEVGGQTLALRRAYARAGYGPDAIGLFEGHGTGTEVGDAVELTALSGEVGEPAGGRPPVAVGSVKANIGHTKAAAGVAGLIKAVLAVHHGILPPATGCEDPHPVLAGASSPLRVLDAPEPWPAGRRLLAGVSAMGFGGINTHLTVEGDAPARGARPGGREAALGATSQDHELVPLAAPDLAALAARARSLAQAAGAMSFGQVRDLAISRALEGPARMRARAAVVAATPDELESRLLALAGAVESGRPAAPTGPWTFAYSKAAAPPRIGFLFPGQASPTYLDGGAVARRFPAAGRLVEEARLEGGADLRDTAIAQPAIAASSAAGLVALAACGVEAGVAAGHSLGELVALHWAGVLRASDLVALARARGRAMAACPGERGAMADLAAGEPVVRELIAGLPVTIAAYNAPDRLVVSGPAEAVGRAVERARGRGVRATPLAVSHAFHSPLVTPAATAFARALEGHHLAPPARSVVSTVTGAPLAPDADLGDLLVRQIGQPVRFTDALAAVASRVDLLIEVGPGHVLTDLAQGTGVPAVATDAGSRSLAGVLRAAGAAFVLGAPVSFAALAEGRVAHPKDALAPRSFLVNPCELAPDDEGVPSVASSPAAPGEEAASPPAGGAAAGDPVEVLRLLIARRVELPLEAVPAGSRLAVDLKLNSITVAQIAVEAAAELGVRPPSAPTEFSDATIAELGAVLASAAPADGTEAAGAPPGVASWVRPFRVEWRQRPRRGPRTPCDWRVAGGEGDAGAARVREAFAGGSGEPALAVYVAPGREVGDAVRLLEAARRALDPEDCRRLAVIAPAGGAGGIVRTLALERPDLTVRLIEPVGELTPDLAAEARAEAETGGGFAEVRLGSGRRLVPRLRPVRVEPGEPRLGAGDVVVVTGGGRGIGAECALALARATGARVAVLGRSDPDREPDLAENLRRLAAAGVTARYLRADVGDAAAVGAAIAAAERELGPVTAILHAAGVNEPRLLRDLDAGALAATLRPKLEGLANLLAAVDQRRLRLLVGFGSIIAASGMRGEAHYALANEWLRLAVAEAGDRLPGCRCLTVEWSVWAGAGMGDRLDLVEALARLGVTPIAIDDGTRLLAELIDAAEVPSSVVACGRYGEPPTLRLDRAEMPLLRFLERPRVVYPGIELVADATLSPATDPYLLDHALQGVPLLPAVVGLEAMAQATVGLTGRRPSAFESVELARPVTVPPDGSRVVRLAALARGDDVVEVVLRSDETGFAVDHFRALCRLAPLPALPPLPEPGMDSGEAGDEAAEALYRRLLFHGPRFQRVRGYRHLRSRSCVAELAAGGGADWFGRDLPAALVLGDAGARDAFIHAAQACIPHRRVLPVAVERIDAGRPAAGPVTVTAIERSATPEALVYDLDVRDLDGRPVEAWRGLTLRILDPLPAPAEWEPGLFVPYLERRAGELLGRRVDAALSPVPAGAARRNGRTAVALGRAVLHRPDGRPELDGGDGVSIAHGGALTLTVAAAGTVACDLEAVAARPPAVWEGMLGGRLALGRVLAAETGEDLDAAATRVWTAIECVTKAGRPPGEPIVFEAAAGDGWVLLRSGALRIATLLVRLGRPGSPAVAGVLVDGAVPGG
jgi:enediyne polyketide synthase